jgi:hypothetical protein
MATVDQSVERQATVGGLTGFLRNPRLGAWAGLAGKLIGLGLFATLVYTYCNVLLEACIRGIH